jgi:murein tripeptide amidase MpaA
MTTGDGISVELQRVSQALYGIQVMVEGLKEHLIRVERRQEDEIRSLRAQLQEHDDSLYKGNGKDSIQTQLGLSRRMHEENVNRFRDVSEKLDTLIEERTQERTQRHWETMVRWAVTALVAAASGIASAIGYARVQGPPPPWGGP